MKKSEWNIQLQGLKSSIKLFLKCIKKKHSFHLLVKQKKKKSACAFKKRAAMATNQITLPLTDCRSPSS